MKRSLLLVVVLVVVVVGVLSFQYLKQPELKPEKTLEGRKILFIISFSQFRDEELEKPKQILEQAGATIVIASDQKGTAEGALGMKVDVEVSLDQVKVDEYDAIIYIGGPGTPDHLWGNRYAIEIAREAYKGDKVIGAICLAPGVLAEAGILEGKRATVFSAAIEKLEQAGCTYVDQSVVKDGNIITANGPGAAEEFGEKIKEALST